MHNIKIDVIEKMIERETANREAVPAGTIDWYTYQNRIDLLTEVIDSAVEKEEVKEVKEVEEPKKAEEVKEVKEVKEEKESVPLATGKITKLPKKKKGDSEEEDDND